MCETSCEKKYVEKLEKGIRLSPGVLTDTIGPNGLPITAVDFSHEGCTFLWLNKLLKGTESISDVCQSGEKEYQACRDSAGNLFLIDHKKGSKDSIVGYTQAEIINVFAEVKEKTTPDL